MSIPATIMDLLLETEWTRVRVPGLHPAKGHVYCLDSGTSVLGTHGHPTTQGGMAMCLRKLHDELDQNGHLWLSGRCRTFVSIISHEERRVLQPNNIWRLGWPGEQNPILDDFSTKI